MEVLLNIPKDVERYIEFIPREALSAILIDLVRESILGRNVLQPKSQAKSGVDIADIIEMLKKTDLGTPVPYLESNTVKSESAVGIDEDNSNSDIKETMSRVIISNDDDSDMDDFMDLLK